MSIFPTISATLPLSEASHFGHFLVVKELIAAKADINGKNTAGESALSLASQKGHTEVIQQLIKAQNKK